MDLGLTGAVALITGASRGIGLATARALAAEGVHLVISARSEAALAEAAAALGGAGVSVTPVVADVTVPEQAEALVARAAGAHGGFDILINNVGGGQGERTIAGSTDADWLRTLELNLFQTVRMIRLSTPHMAGRPHPAVVNVSSISGWVPQLAGSGQYGAAKAALIFDADTWARELWAQGIRLNTVSPGSILVPGNGWDRYRAADPEGFEAYVTHGFPMGRLGHAEEVADVITFIVSPRSHWINGRNIPVDGLEQPFAAPRR
jgi:3-oxoacyl-[acyl-carrier protein] reductase